MGETRGYPETEFVASENVARVEIEDLPNEVERAQEEIREHLFKKLRAEDVLSETASGEMVVDTERLSSAVGHIVKNSKRLFRRHPELGGANTRTAVAYTFFDTPIIARSDLERCQGTDKAPEAKPLMYIPESQEAAFDPKAIAAQKFHLASWDVAPPHFT